MHTVAIRSYLCFKFVAETGHKGRFETAAETAGRFGRGSQPVPGRPNSGFHRFSIRFFHSFHILSIPFLKIQCSMPFVIPFHLTLGHLQGFTCGAEIQPAHIDLSEMHRCRQFPKAKDGQRLPKNIKIAAIQNYASEVLT